MELLFILPAFIIFLYWIYKLVKDDYIFIRKGISLEQMFDVIFSVLWISLFTSRFFYFVFHSFPQLFRSYFSLPKGGFSLVGAVIGGVITLYIISKYRKIPLGRIFDFVSLAFLLSLPVGLVSVAFIHKGIPFYVYLSEAVFYLFLTIFFMRALYPRLLSRTIKEGSVALYFFLLYFITSLVSSLVYRILTKSAIANIENVIIVLLFIGSCILVFKQDRGHKSKKT